MEGRRTVGDCRGKTIGQAQAEAGRIVEELRPNRQWVAEFNKMITRGEAGYDYVLIGGVMSRKIY